MYAEHSQARKTADERYRVQQPEDPAVVAPARAERQPVNEVGESRP